MKPFNIKIKDLYFTQRQISLIVLHLIGMIITWAVWSHLMYHYHRIFEVPFTVGGWLVITVIVFSLLDYLDIINYRKSHERFTKCIICDRTSKVNKFSDKTRTITDVRERGKDEEDQIDKEATIEKLTTKEKPETPLHGIIIYDKMVCRECSIKIKRMFES